MPTNSQKQIGFWIVTSLVVGNMIGSGIFILPAALAPFGGISFLGWIASGLGALAVAAVFGRLSKLVPKTGGPYIFPREGFGRFAGFLSGFGYWISVLLTNASMALAFTGYLFVFIPTFKDSSIATLIVGLGTLWFLTWVNSRGVRSGGTMQLVTTIMKIVPLVLVTLAGFFYFNGNHFVPFNASGKSDLIALGTTVAITLFAFLGVESGTIPAGNVKDPSKTIPRATVLGTIFTIIIYMLSTGSIMGVLEPDVLRSSTAPFADAAKVIWGESGEMLVAFGAMISIFGALNGWTLITAQIPSAMARDDMMPPVFKKESSNGYPIGSLIISSLIVTVIILMNFTRGLIELYTLLILVGTFLTLITYLFSSMAETLIVIKQKPEAWKRKAARAFLLGLPAFIFSVWAMFGSGQKIVFYGFILLILGIPFYVYARMRKNNVYK